MTDRELLEALRNVFARALYEAERRDGQHRGMGVPYHGEFGCVLHFPSVRRDLRDLERWIASHLEAPHA